MKYTPPRHQQSPTRIVKTDAREQIVYGEVYAPNVIDSHGNIMLPEDVKLLAHRFLRDVVLGRSIDVNHDNVPRHAYPVESFVARENDPDYRSGAWVLGVKIEDEAVWADVEAGRLNGFSFEVWARKEQVEIEVEITPHTLGETSPSESDGHTHLMMVLLNDDGRVVGGRTTVTNGHFHTITRGTITDSADGHNHRFGIDERDPAAE